MYEFLTGTVVEITPSYIVLENQGVGYLVYCANPFRYEENTETKIFVYQAVRENSITLYGFKTSSEKKLFLKLLDVSGIGPKSALAILANDDNRGLVFAIDNDDDKYLTKFQGLGRKQQNRLYLI